MSTTKYFAVNITKIIPAYSFFGLFRFGPKIFLHIKVTCDMRGKIYSFISHGPQINFEKMFDKDIQKARTEVMAMLKAHNTYTSRISKALTVTTRPVRNGPEPRPISTTFKEHRMPRRSVRGAEIIPMPTLIPKTLAPPEVPIKPYQKMKTIEYVETDATAFGDTSKMYNRRTL